MIQVSPILRKTEDNGLMFWCPGCDGAHQIKHGEGPGPRWNWNGSVDKPTFSPSVLVKGTTFTAKGRSDYESWRDNGYQPAEDGQLKFDRAPTVCHSFVTDGRIQFLGDCTHAMAGKTVDLPGWSDE